MMSYLKKRFEERSTWAAIGVAVTAGAAVASPYSWILIGIGVVGVLVPMSGGEADAPNPPGDGP